MALTPGSRLGPYEITGQIGVGGMGEVYRAIDTNLKRAIAIKVLPDAVAADPERLARFQREAEVLASLNHPNIAAIYGLERTDGTTALVMELVEGPTLADRIAHGPIPLEEALGIAEQIAEGLEAAHERGIIHRDLKTANIKLRVDGAVKILDFGLARIVESAGPMSASVTASPTITSPALMTGVGVLLGTAAYMSPEQAKGRPADKRSDIWAFGCVLFEMLTGRRAFAGGDTTEVLASVIKSEPAWETLPFDTPSRVRRVLYRCLQKDVGRRLRDIADARIELEDASLADPQPQLVASVARTDTPRRRWPFTVGAISLAAVSAFAAWSLKPARSPGPFNQLSRFTIAMAPGARLTAADQLQPSLAISPDGTRLVYSATRGGAQQLYLRKLDSLEASPIPGTLGGNNPFFSPDGQWIAFFVEGNLQRVSVSGGAPVGVASVSRVSQPLGGTWSDDGTIVFGFNINPHLAKVSANGGIPQPISFPDLDRDDLRHSWPAFLPNGQALFFTVSGTGAAGSKIAVGVLATGERKDLFTGGSRATYASSGHLVYESADSLMAVRFDLATMAIAGSPFAVVRGVMPRQYSLSNTGVLVYVPASASSTEEQLVWVDRNGREQPLGAPARRYGRPQLSRDGLHVAVAIEGQIWIYDREREVLRRLTTEGGGNPTWTADGKRVAYQVTIDGHVNLFWQAADGSGKQERLTSGEHRHAPSSFSQDGQFLAFTEVHPATGSDIWVLRLSDRQVQPFLKAAGDQGAPRFSPDGHALAYISDESGRREVWVESFPGPAKRVQISTDGGIEPVWNPDGKELFFRNGDRMMSVQISTTPSLAAGKPRALFEAQYQRAGGNLASYDVAPDGRRFLMQKGEQEASGINVVLNWQEELKRLVPTR